MPSRLDAAYSAQVKAIRSRAEVFALARFAAGQYRDADLAAFVSSVVPVVLAARRQVSALTDSYLSSVLSAALGRRVAPRGPIDTHVLRGVDVSEVYARPYVTVRTKLSEGRPLDVAVSAGTKRVSDIVVTDMQLAKRDTAQRVLSNTAEVVGYERTLTGSMSCALCFVASTQRYHKADLLPIHPGCDCGVSPIVDTGVRVEPVIHPDRLAAAHEAVEDRLGVSDSGARAVDYRKQLIVHEHGELGPVLAVRGQHFTGKSGH